MNLTRLAQAFPGKASRDSNYRRLQRFLSDRFYVDYNVIARFIVSLFGFLSSEGFYLTMDRTNWKWGKKSINILMLAIVYKGTAIPVYWVLLNTEGNSDTRERIALVKRFIDQFGREKIIKLLADREFVGKDWFDWLCLQQIDFAIRIKESYLVSNSQGAQVKAKELFRMLKPSEAVVLDGQRRLFKDNSLVYISALRLDDGSLLIVATGNPCSDAIESYALRWEIETLFGCLKSRGFNFEDTHVTERRRIKKLLIVLAIAFCWAHRTGEWQHEQVKPITVKKHGRAAKSLFRVGMELIIDALFAPLKPAPVDLSAVTKWLFPQRVEGLV